MIEQEELMVKQNKTNSNPPIITTVGLCRDFHTGGEVVHALKNVNIEIKPGKLTVLRGRSGSGKSTLINLLGGLDLPTRGKIYFKGKEVSSMSNSKRERLRRESFGFIFQSVAIISVMSAY